METKWQLSLKPNPFSDQKADRSVQRKTYHPIAAKTNRNGPTVDLIKLKSALSAARFEAK